MKNTSLKSDLKSLIKDQGNITSIQKGDVSDSSIEFYFKEPISQGSYVYYQDVASRDADYEELKTLLAELVI